MSHYNYERLSAQDNDFLLWEKPNLPMHVGVTQIFAAGSLALAGGGIDFPAIKSRIEAILHRVPRYRQKVMRIPGSSRRVWVDDAQFSIDYHMRHTALPHPGDEDQLKQLSARILERPLDRARPLWEMWVVEGLQGDRFAMICKMHHCVCDGAAGMNLARNLYSLTPHEKIAPARRFIPRALPPRAQLRRDEWAEFLGLPWRVTGDLLRFARRADDLSAELAARLRALAEMALLKIVPASHTPLNGPVGPHRALDWLTLSLADLKAMRRAFDCSVNDLILTLVCGAVREFMLRRQVRPEGLEFRVSAPVNVRSEREQGRKEGNRVSSWVLTLPIGEADPLAQLGRIRDSTRHLKESRQAVAVEMVEAIHEWLPLDIQALASGTQNMFVSNVPGPQFPLFLSGAELLELYGQPPLIENLGLVVSVISYNGKVCFALTADPDRVPDLPDFTELLRAAFLRLQAAALPRPVAKRRVDGAALKVVKAPQVAAKRTRAGRRLAPRQGAAQRH